MSYKTVLLHIDDGAGRAARIALAAKVAQACGGQGPADAESQDGLACAPGQPGQDKTRAIIHGAYRRSRLTARHG